VDKSREKAFCKLLEILFLLTCPLTTDGFQTRIS
jgi:hypothetical protein